MIPMAITAETDWCMLSDRWQISHALARVLIRLARNLEFGIMIISGHRTPEQQADLLSDPNSKAAPVDRSTHTVCPATGADIWPTIGVTNAVRARLGAEATLVGLRWGGGSPIDPQTGIPSDWNHLDLGPRQ